MSAKRVWSKEFYLKAAIVMRLAEMQSFHVDIAASDIVHDITIIIEDLMSCDIHTNFSAYYGKLKVVITQFLDYWHRITDEIKYYDDDFSLAEKDNLFLLCRQSKINNYQRHERFKREVRQYMPDVCSEVYYLVEKMNRESEAIDKQYDVLAEKISWLLYKEQYVDLFKELLAECKAWVQTVFDNGADCLSVALQIQIPQLRDNFKIICHSVNHNIDILEQENKRKVDDIKEKLYLLNKEKYALKRSMERVSENKMAEVDFRISELQKSLTKQIRYKCFGLVELYEKRAYYTGLADHINYVANNLHELQEKMLFVEDLIKATQKDYTLKMRDIGMDEFFTDFEKLHMILCLEKKWGRFQCECADALENIREAHKNTRKLLITTLCVQGKNHKLYSGVMGEFYVNEYARKVYSNTFSIEEYVPDCEGLLQKMVEPEKEYYYDTYGKYFIDKNCVHTYRRSECSSNYRLAPEGYLVKITQDCGHSNTGNIFCGQNLIPQPAIMVPNRENVLTKGSLKSDDFKYLWDNVGIGVTKAAFGVTKAKPLNPIYCMARNLLKNKYSFNKQREGDVFKKDLDESIKHREDVQRQRNEVREKARQEWLKIQMKAGDGTESDMLYKRQEYLKQEQTAHEGSHNFLQN